MIILDKLPAGFLKDPWNFCAFGFGSGCSPKAPGTAGTVVALALYWPLQSLPLIAYLAFVVFAFGIGILICQKASDALGVHDHGGIVWDEFVGYWITMICAPAGILWALWGFVLFRIFDIWKPFPIKTVDAKVHGGFGVMLDDALAGVYALLALQLTAWLLI